MTEQKDISLQYFPRDWQRKCHRDRRRFTVLALHRRAGKTELAIMELLDKALRFDKDLGLFFYVAPFLKQAKAIAWARLKQRVEPLRITNLVEIQESELSVKFKHNGSELSVKFKHNGATIRIFGADNPHAMRGVRLDGAVIDEVAQIKPEVWGDIIQPALSDRKGWALFIGTPQGVNLFSELFFKAQSTPEWHSLKFTVYDTGSIDPEEVYRLKRDMSETSFAREYMCDFSAAGDDQLISLSDVEAAANRVMTERDVSYAPKIIGVDPARFGDDRSVIFKRQGLQAFSPAVYRGIDNMDLASRVAALIQEWEPDAVFVDAG
ncbi:MAG: terminase, partial [Proteobacteria bacterium]|nr:terminase [Pseudomonadota bacterium]